MYPSTNQSKQQTTLINAVVFWFKTYPIHHSISISIDCTPKLTYRPIVSSTALTMSDQTVGRRQHNIPDFTENMSYMNGQ
jgi:hypothetical protein